MRDPEVRVKFSLSSEVGERLMRSPATPNILLWRHLAIALSRRPAPVKSRQSELRPCRLRPILNIAKMVSVAPQGFLIVSGGEGRSQSGAFGSVLVLLFSGRGTGITTPWEDMGLWKRFLRLP